MKLLQAPIFGLLLALQPFASAQAPDPNSPRFKAVSEIRELFASPGADAVTLFVADRFALALMEDESAVEDLARALEAAAGSRFSGATAEGPNSARVTFRLSSGASASVSFETEPEAPYRFVRLDLSGFDLHAGPLSDAEIAQALTEYVDKLASQDRFSGAVLLARGKQPILRKAYGLASKRFDVPNKADTKFNLGSMNKMFTGLAICQLAEAGKLAFDDTVGEHLPDYPNREVAEKVTIHHLLTHTSGLGSYWNEEWERRWTSLRTVADLLPLFADDALAFEPGDRFQYSNVGPVVLGLVIEAISGQSYYDYVREHIYGPCGMANTDCYDMDRPVPNLAIGYTKHAPDGSTGDGSWRNNLFSHSIKGGPAGGGFSTVDDMLLFSLALQNHELLPAEMTETMLTGKVAMGPDAKYAYLYGDHRTGGHRSHGHNGGAPGISADFAFYPDLGYTLVVLSNYDGGAMPVSTFMRELIERHPPSDKAR